MKKIKLCLGVSAALSDNAPLTINEKCYLAKFNKLISAMYKWNQTPFALHLSGFVLEGLEKFHPESIILLREMTARKQISMISGGYYEPLLPLLSSVDREWQIESLTSLLTRLFSQRPRGGWCIGSAWDSALASSFSACGLQYIFLDKDLTASSGLPAADSFSPIVTEYSGKSIVVFPVETALFNQGNITPNDFFDYLMNNADDDGEANPPILCCFFKIEKYLELFSAQSKANCWFKRFLGLIEESGGAVEITSPGAYLQTSRKLPFCYIPQGAAPAINRWSAFKADEYELDVKLLARNSIRKFLLRYPCFFDLYCKMTYVSSLVNLIRGDKSRKNEARRNVLKAQYSGGYWYIGTEDVLVRRSLDSAYENLIITEKIVRAFLRKSADMTSFDFDFDGLKEYICSFDLLNIYIHVKGGVIFELDDLSRFRNYANILSRSPENGASRNKKLFVDHLISPQALPSDLKNAADAPVFADVLYQAASFDKKKRELSLKAEGLYGSLKQSVSLRKRYTFREKSIYVQYILKNDSPFHLSALFAVEINLALESAALKDQRLTVFSRDEKLQEPVRGAGSVYGAVSWLQLEDTAGGSRFFFETNENANMAVIPLQTADAFGGAESAICEGSSVYAYWNVELDPGLETEKILSLAIE